MVDVTELHQTETKLQESEERFRNLIEGSIQGFLVHRDYKLLFVNPAMADIFGYDSPEDLLRMGDILKLVAPHERERMKEFKISREKGNDVPKHYEFQGIRKDGFKIWLEITGRGVYWNGEFALQGTLYDITQRKRAEEALRESEARFRLLVESISAITWEANLVTSRFTYVGPQASKITGYPPEKWVDFDFWASIIHPEDREWAVQFRFDSAKTCVDHVFEYRIIKPNGHEVWVQDTVIVEKEAGHPVLMRGFIIDISERKRAEGERTASEEKFRNLVEGSIEAIIIHRNYKPLFVNQAYADMLGFETREKALETEKISQLIAPIDRDRMIALNEKRMRGKNVPDHYEIKVIRLDGKEIWVTGVSQAINWERETATLATLIDITERK